MAPRPSQTLSLSVFATRRSKVLLSYPVHFQPLKPGPDEVIDHGYAVPTKEGGVLIVQNLERQTEQKHVNLQLCPRIYRHKI